MKKIDLLRIELKRHANPIKASILQRFFKTGKGQYGEGDIFLGITVPASRKFARKYKDLNESEIKSLFKSKIHEERLIAVLILVHNFENGDEQIKKKIFEYYLANTAYINNWDLVDLSADKIVGAYLLNKPRKILYKMARSNNLWERRIAIISTFNFIKNDQSKDTFDIAKILLNDKHDLIHKAVGWMLREVGKRVSLEQEMFFLNKYANKMPRTMLRYAIERMNGPHRERYLLKTR